MAMSTAVSSRSTGEYIAHFTGVRMRVVGAGSLQMWLRSFDEVRSFTMVPFALSATTSIEPFRLANFVQQRAILEAKTTEINEVMRVNRIIIYAKRQYEDYPGLLNAL